MKVQYLPTTVRLERGQWEAVRALARASETTPAEVIRAAIAAHLAGAALRSTSARRLARINEYKHLVLDLIMREQFPDLRDRLIAETDRRLEQYHGA